MEIESLPVFLFINSQNMGIVHTVGVNMSDQRFKSMSVDAETYKKLATIARRNYRSMSAEVRRLVDEEIERQAVMEPDRTRIWRH